MHSGNWPIWGISWGLRADPVQTPRNAHRFPYVRIEASMKRAPKGPRSRKRPGSARTLLRCLTLDASQLPKRGEIRPIRSGDECFEWLHLQWIGSVHHLRVPLHSKHEGCPQKGDRLYDAVVGLAIQLQL
jgi:hypothetical protein